MNAAARLVQDNVLSYSSIALRLISGPYMVVMFLALVTFFSALSVIYVAHTTRLVHARYTRSLAEYYDLQMQASQLLLEKSTWMRQKHIQSIAREKLGMETPARESIIFIHE